MRHRSIAAAAVATVLLICVPVFGGETGESAKKKAAQKAAESWLSLVDSGKYGESWSAAATLFRNAIPQEKWEATIRAVRDPLGKLSSRAFKSADYSTSLPGAPDGEYVVLQYDTVFEHKHAAVETIVPMLEADGTWKVSGYFIK